MQPILAAARRIELQDNRVWRGALLLIFVLGISARFLVYLDLADKPAGRMQEWPATEPAAFVDTARRIVENNEWLLPKRVSAVTPEMRRAASERTWATWSDGRMPRGVAAIYLLAGSIGLTSSLSIYKFFAITFGGLIAVLAAAFSARAFQSRRVGFLVGVVLGCTQSLVLASIIIGPWQWEALLFVALLNVSTRIADDINNVAEWLLFGVLAGIAIWLRPIFFWAPVLLLIYAASRKNLRVNLTAALVIPVLLFAAGISARNVATRSTPLPILGDQAWDFLYNSNPGALRTPVVPSDVEVIAASHGSFLRALRITEGISTYRAAAPRIVQRKLREMLGARDVASTVNSDYLRLRSDVLRLIAFPPDVVMAAGWAGLVLLMVLRKIPRSLFVVLALLLAHGLLFGTGGFDRVPIMICFAIFACAGMIAAWDARTSLRAMPFAFVTLWAVFHVALQIDDQARGSRYRDSDFRVAAIEYRRAGQEKKFREELQTADRIHVAEGDLDNYWNTQR